MSSEDDDEYLRDSGWMKNHIGNWTDPHTKIAMANEAYALSIQLDRNARRRNYLERARPSDVARTSSVGCGHIGYGKECAACKAGF